MDRGAWKATDYEGLKESDTTEHTRTDTHTHTCTDFHLVLWKVPKSPSVWCGVLEEARASRRLQYHGRNGGSGLRVGKGHIKDQLRVWPWGQKSEDMGPNFIACFSISSGTSENLTNLDKLLLPHTSKGIMRCSRFVAWELNETIYVKPSRQYTGHLKAFIRSSHYYHDPLHFRFRTYNRNITQSSSKSKMQGVIVMVATPNKSLQMACALSWTEYIKTHS